MKIRTIILLLVIFSGSNSFSQTRDSSWGKLNFLIGNWQGEGEGKPGQGQGIFSFMPDLKGNVLIRRGHTVIPASKDKPASFHEDLMIIYKNDSGQPEKAIYFDNEKHVINYTVSSKDSSMVFVSEAAGVAPRYRLTYTRLADKTIQVKFEMSPASKPDEFKMYLTGKAVKLGK
jgi:hypothetical protein